jgi:hypothetical protein
MAVAMFVASVLLAGVGTVFVGTLRSVSTLTVKTSAAADTRIAMEALERSLRVAVQPSGEPAALVSASTTAVSFYAMIGATSDTVSKTLKPSLVEYAYDSTAKCLTQAVTPPSSGSPTTWTTGRTSRCLVRTTSGSLSFAYYTTGQLTAGGTAVPTIAPVSGAITTADLPLVQSVEVALTVTDPAHPTVSGVPATSRVTLQNVLSAE